MYVAPGAVVGGGVRSSAVGGSRADRPVAQVPLEPCPAAAGLQGDCVEEVIVA